MALGPLFDGSEVEAPATDRRIGKGPAPPAHKATTAVPAGLLQMVDESFRARCCQKAAEAVATLVPQLGKPYYARDGFILYHRPCEEILEAMSRRSVEVQLALTSPPYNIGKAYEENLPLPEYVAWCSAWMKLIWDVTSRDGAFWLNLGYFPVVKKGRAVPIAYLLWDRSPFFLQQEIVWHYGAGVAAKRFFAPRNEKWLFYTKDAENFVFNLDDVRDPNVKYPNQKKNGKFRCNPLGKNPSDVWEFPKVTTGTNRSSKERSSHPAQFPLAVVDRIVKTSSRYCDLVIDPFSGSGSSGIAAVGNGRVYVGSEIREDYCRETADRYEHFLQLRDMNFEPKELALF